MGKLKIGLEFDGEYDERVRAELEQIVATLQVWQAQVSSNDAQFLVAASDDNLTAERVGVNSPTVRVDYGTTGQAKWHIDPSVIGAGYMMSGGGGEEGSDGPPGRDGAPGAAGSAGATGAAGTGIIPCFDGDDGMDCWLQGPQGATGPVNANITTIIKTADESVTTNTALQNDDVLLLALLTNTNYVVEGLLFVNAPTAGDIKVAFTVPTSATGQMSFLGPIVAVSTNDQLQRGAVINDFTTPDFINFGGLGTTATTIVQVYISGSIFTAGTAGNLQLQWAQNASSGTTTVLKGSWLRVTKV